MPRAMSLRAERQYRGSLRRTSSKALTLKRASMMPVMACRRALSESLLPMPEVTPRRAHGSVRWRTVLGSFGEGVLAGRIVAAAPVGPAARGALARDHLDGAGRAGGGAEIALRRELEERERLFRQQRGDPGDQLVAVDQADLLLAGEIAGFLGELARGHQHALADVARCHGAAQLAHRIDADAIRVPRIALHEDGS